MGLITDLIKEYPALSVAKERLALAQEKYDALSMENEKLKAKVKYLEQENKQLKTKLDEIVPHGEENLSEIEINILKLFGIAGHDLVIDAVASRLGLSQTKTEYYLSKLCDEEYLGFPLIMGGGETEYYLQQKGREYLVKNDLIE